MKRIILLVAFIAATSVASADDSYLWWMADTANAGYEYDEVRVRAFSSSDSQYLSLYTTDYESLGTSIGGASSSGTRSAVESMSSIGFYASLATYQSGYSYIVELYNDNMFVADSAALLYSGAADYIQLATAAGTINPATSMWAAGSYSVPEPNSALLMALGFAAMALRRRKMIKA